MKKAIVFFLLSILATSTHAQNTFEHVFTSQHNVIDVESCFKSLELPNGDYIAMGMNPGCEFCFKDYYIRKYDHQGNLIFEKQIIAGSGGDSPDIIQTKDGNLLFYFGYGLTSANLTWDYQLYFYKMDLNGDTLFTKNYYYQRTDQNGIDQIQLNELADSSIVFSCNEIMLKLSSNLDSSKSIPIARPAFIPSLKFNNSELICPKSYSTPHGDSIALIVYNGSLDSIKTISFPDSNFTSATSFGWGINYLAEFTDGKYFCEARKGFGNSDSLGLICFDSLLNIVWAKYMVTPVHTRIYDKITFSNSSITFYGYQVDLSSFKYSASFYRTSLAGDSLQFKLFLAENIYPSTLLRYLKYCSEGYLVSGYAQADTTGWKSYFAVLDTLGNVTSSIATLENLPMQVYRNPTNSYFQVEISGENSYQYKLTDAKGRIVEIKKGSGKMDFNLENYAAGNYFLSVTGDRVKRQVIIIKQ